MACAASVPHLVVPGEARVVQYDVDEEAGGDEAGQHALAGDLGAQSQHVHSVHGDVEQRAWDTASGE